MLRLALADIENGNSTLVIDPKGDLVRDILERYPKAREDDLVIIAPTSERPIGINPFDLINYGISPELLTRHLMAVFQDLFSDNRGIRSSDVLNHAILTLTKTKHATLLMLPQLLTNKYFRQTLLKDIHDPFGVESFWNYYDNLSQGEQMQFMDKRKIPTTLRIGLSIQLQQKSLSEYLTRLRVAKVYLKLLGL